MKVLPLEKIIDTNREYKAEHNKFYVIDYIGTNVDVDYIEIEGRRTTPLDSTLSPVRTTTSNLFGPLDLKDQFIVIPPLHRFKFVSSASGKVYISGKIGVLEFGEGLPADVQTRFKNMHLSYLRPITISKSLGTDVKINPGAEIEIKSIIPSTIERYILCERIGISVANAGTIADGTLGLRFYYDDTPMDILDTDAGTFGIDVNKMPLPPTETTEMEYFSLENFPIVIEPNHKLTLKVYNNSSTAISPPTGQSITITVKAIALYNIIG